MVEDPFFDINRKKNKVLRNNQVQLYKSDNLMDLFLNMTTVSLNAKRGFLYLYDIVR